MYYEELTLYLKIMKPDSASMRTNSQVSEILLVYGNVLHLICLLTNKVTAPQDAHGRLVLQVYLGSNTLKFSAIRR